MSFRLFSFASAVFTLRDSPIHFRRAVATMVAGPRSVSEQPRVFHLQSGLTPKCEGGITVAALRKQVVISSVKGRRGM